MILLLIIGLVLIALAVALVARGANVSRFRTVDTLGQIGYYGFTGAAVDLEPNAGFRGFLDSSASGIGVLLTEKLNIINEERLRKNLVAAGMYQTTPREVIGYSLLSALVLPALGIWLAIAAGASATLAILLAIFLAVVGWVAPGFVIQTGALNTRATPLTENQQKLVHNLTPEFNDTKHVKGIVSMARGDAPDSATTSFFICTGASTALDGQYTAFGRVVDGLSVVEAIEQTPRDGETPRTRIELRSIRIERR